MSRFDPALDAQSKEFLSALERQKILPPIPSLVNVAPAKIERSGKTQIDLIASDTISAAIHAHSTALDARICILNFSSYKHPGGGFISGMKAQEETLCHCTNLYAELCRHQDWYDAHKKDLNRGLYRNECLLNMGVTVVASSICQFLKPQERFRVDVLTCAAPNWSSIILYAPKDKPLAVNATRDRIKYVCNVLGQGYYDYLILGAYGCGVFKNDPDLVANSFKSEIAKSCTAKNIIFAIPDSMSGNYKAFLRVFGEHCQL